MKTKSLAAKNRYLKKASCEQMLARNLASSTSIETGKNSVIYVKRYSATRPVKGITLHSLKPAKPVHRLNLSTKKPSPTRFFPVKVSLRNPCDTLSAQCII